MPNFITVTLPAEFASYYVNGDASGLTGEGKRRADELLANNGLRIVSTVDEAEPRFTWSFHLYGGDSQGGEVLDYLAEELDPESEEAPR